MRNSIAISTSVADHLSGVSSVGGVIGVSVSASFLLVLALVNAFILARTLHQRKRVCFPGRSRLTKRLLMRVILLKIRRRRAEVESGHHHAIEPKEPLPMMGCVSRLVLPLFKMLDRPWKVSSADTFMFLRADEPTAQMYPIGVLFGLGFDTSSEIALLAVSALAKYNPDAPGIANSEIIILVGCCWLLRTCVNSMTSRQPFLFAAGMSLVDCLDNVFMLYAYTSAQTFDAVTEEVFHEADSKSTKSSEVVAVDEAPVSPQIVDELSDVPIVELRRSSPTSAIRIDVDAEPSAADAPSKQVVPAPSELERVQAVKMSTISDLSIMLTVVSIVVALFISLVEFMGYVLVRPSLHKSSRVVFLQARCRKVRVVRRGGGERPRALGSMVALLDSDQRQLGIPRRRRCGLHGAHRGELVSTPLAQEAAKTKDRSAGTDVIAISH